MKIRRKLTLLLMVTGIIPLVFSMAISLWHSVAQVREKTLLSVENQLMTGAQELSGFFAARMAEISAYTNSPILRTMDWKIIGPYLKEEMKRHRSVYEKLYMGNPDGTYYSTNSGNPYLNDLTSFNDSSPAAKPKNLKRRNYWKYIVADNAAGEHRVKVSDPVISYSTGVKQVIIASSIGSGGKTVGMLGGTVDWVKIESLVKTVKGHMVELLGSDIQLCMVSGNGIYVYHRDPDKVIHERLDDRGRPVVDESGERVTVSRRITDDPNPDIASAGRHMIMGGSGYISFHDRASHRDMYLIYAPVSSVEYSMGLFVPVNTVLKPVFSLTRFLMTVLVSALILTVLASILLSTGISNRIVELTRAVGDFTSGEKTLQTDSTGDDEIGELTASFNTMARTLHEREVSLRRSILRYQNLVDTMHEGLVVRDDAGKITYINESFSRMLGYPWQEVVGRDIEDFIHPSARAVYISRKEPDLTGKGEKYELSWVRKDGETVLTLISPSVIRDEREMSTGVLATVTNISREKKAEAEKEHIQAQLIQAQKMEAIGTLASGIAHDFNNILSGVMGSLELTEISLNGPEGTYDRQIHHHIDTARKSANRAVNMVKQLLSVSRKAELKLVSTDINRPVGTVIDICKNSFPRGIQIESSLSPVPLRVLTDEGRLEQLLLNLCLNASHALTIMRQPGERQGGTISIEVDKISGGHAMEHMHPEANPAVSYVRIQVIDDGVGMDEDTLKRIFDPFFTTKPMDLGTGLGMAMVYTIVQLHGGFVDVWSKPGRGTTVNVFLPLYDGAAGPAGILDEGEPLVHGAGHVLVIDDETTLLDILSEMLTLCGYTVLTAAGGKKGIELFQLYREEIRAVILDLSMPHMSGEEVLVQLKAMDPNVRILIASGYIGEGARKTMADYGVTDFIVKPYSPRELTRMLDTLIQRPAVRA